MARGLALPEALFPGGQSQSSMLGGGGERFGVCQEWYSRNPGTLLILTVSTEMRRIRVGRAFRFWEGPCHGPRFGCCCFHRELAHSCCVMLVCVGVHVRPRSDVCLQPSGVWAGLCCCVCWVVCVSLSLFPSFIHLTSSPHWFMTLWSLQVILSGLGPCWDDSSRDCP